MIDLDVLVLALRGVLVFSLYGFLVFVLLVVWHDTRDSGGDRGSEQPGLPSARLVVVDAGQSELTVGCQFELVANGTLGRTEPNSIVIPDAAVSARHCRLSFRNGQWRIEDLGSVNGTRVNGKPVAASTVLNDGDVVEVAQVKLITEIN